MDPQARVVYDSSIEFDESIPEPDEGTKSAKDFFRVYGKVFKRNERFSVVRPCPELGDMDTPWEQVAAFYRFWFGFKSWRDFSYLDEEKVAYGRGGRVRGCAGARVRGRNLGRWSAAPRRHAATLCVAVRAKRSLFVLLCFLLRAR